MNNLMTTNTIPFSLLPKLLHCLQNQIYKKGFHTANNPVVPVKVYANADIQKLEILNENRGKSGIYMWKNLNNDKIYIGSAQNIRSRIMAYYNLNHLTRVFGMRINRALLK